MKVNNLKCKIPDVATLIPINHYITDKQNFEGIKEMLVKKYLMLVVQRQLLFLIQKLVERIIPDVKSSVTTTALNTKIGEVKNKIPTVSDLVKKTDYNAEISDINTKYFTTSDYQQFTSEILGMKVKETKLVGS